MPEPVVEERARARVGMTLNGKYRLDGLLGVGGMAAVYSATHRNNKRFAVKVLHAELSVHSDLRMRFMREGYCANAVDHPGAVAVLDDDVTDDGSAFLVMELLEGETLDAACERFGGHMPLRAVLAVADQVLDVLAVADAKRVVHRDIKPSNLFLTRSGQVKVLDFGVARVRDAQGAYTTNSGLALGTPAFMAPEQALGRSEEINGQTDLWALAATMFSLVTGHAVHEASTAQEQMVFAATKEARSLALADPTTPREVAEVVDRALAFQQAARWENASAMREALRDAHRKVYGEDPSSSALASIASTVLVSGPVSRRSDPVAPTVPATGAVTPEHLPTTGRSSGPNPTSLVGTTAQARTLASSRVRFAVWAAALVLVGAAVGAWAATRQGSARPAEAAAASTFTAVMPATEITTATAPTSVASAVPLPSAGTAAPTPPAPTAAASMAATPTATATAMPRPRPLKPSPPPSAAEQDRFDHQ
jgi:serine/threonine-protein kinase